MILLELPACPTVGATLRVRCKNLLPSLAGKECRTTRQPGSSPAFFGLSFHFWIGTLIDTMAGSLMFFVRGIPDVPKLLVVFSALRAVFFLPSPIAMPITSLAFGSLALSSFGIGTSPCPLQSVPVLPIAFRSHMLV